MWVGKEVHSRTNVHFHILEGDLRLSVVGRIQQHRESSDTSDEQGDSGEEAEDGLRAVQGGMHGELVSGPRVRSVLMKRKGNR